MTTSSQFMPSGGLLPKSIVKGTSAKISALANFASNITAATQVLSGSCTANTLKTILSISGRGSVSYLAANAVDATSRSNRIKITLDGVVIYDITEAAATDQQLIQVIGAVLLNASNAFTGLVENRLDFNNSLLIEYATSVTETDKCRFAYVYYTR